MMHHFVPQQQLDLEIFGASRPCPSKPRLRHARDQRVVCPDPLLCGPRQNIIIKRTAECYAPWVSQQAFGLTLTNSIWETWHLRRLQDLVLGVQCCPQVWNVGFAEPSNDEESDVQLSTLPSTARYKRASAFAQQLHCMKGRSKPCCKIRGNARGFEWLDGLTSPWG